eukprot:3645236-Rhodomonas_salina.1
MERVPSDESTPEKNSELNDDEEDEFALEFGPLHHERKVLGTLTIGFIFHSSLAVVFALVFYALCWHVQSDPEGDVVDGHPVPYRIYGISAAAYGTTLILNVAAWAWTIDSYRARLYIFPLFVNVVSFLCDFALATGWAPVWICSNGRRFLMMRYLKWGITSPSLIYMYSSLSSMADMKVMHYCAICLVMLGAGALSACTGPPHNIAYLFASMVLWLLLVQYLNGLIDNTILNCAPEDEEYRSSLGVAKGLLLVGWIAMPMIFIMAQWELINPTVEEALYELMDFLTKAGGASMILHSSLQTCVEKETERRQKLLAVKRNNCSHMLESMIKVHDELLISTLQTQVTSIVGMVSVAEKMLEEMRSKGKGEEEQSSRTESLAALHTLAQCSLASFEDFCVGAMSAEGEPSSQELLDVSDLLRKIFLVLQSRLPNNTMAQLEFDSSVGEAHFVRASPALVQQVLFSVLSFILHSLATSANPRAFSSSAEPRRARVSITKLAQERGDAVAVTIADDAVPDAATREQLLEVMQAEAQLGRNAKLPSLL